MEQALLKAALKVDIGEIETIAHYKAADYFLSGCRYHFRYWWTGYEMLEN